MHCANTLPQVAIKAKHTRGSVQSDCEKLQETHNTMLQAASNNEVVESEACQLFEHTTDASQYDHVSDH